MVKLAGRQVDINAAECGLLIDVLCFCLVDERDGDQPFHSRTQSPGTSWKCSGGFGLVDRVMRMNFPWPTWLCHLPAFVSWRMLQLIADEVAGVSDVESSSCICEADWFMPCLPVDPCWF